MAKSENTAIVAAKPVTVAPKSMGISALNKQIAGIALMGKTFVQSSTEYQKSLHECALNCFYHAQEHGDATPMLHLLEAIPSHTTTRMLRGEIMSWVKSVSPIHFYIAKDGSNAVRLLKKDEDGHKEFKTEEAQTPFYETKRVVEARDAAFKAAGKSLEPLTLKDIRNRIFGVRKTFESAFEKDKNGNIRGVADGDQAAIKKALSAIEEAFRDSTGKKGAALEAKEAA